MMWSLSLFMFVNALKLGGEDFPGSGWNCAFSIQGTQVQSLVWELRSCMELRQQKKEGYSKFDGFYL